MRVFTSAEHPQKHISEVTKTQLARQCNEQVELIQRQHSQIRLMAKLLIAIAAEPEAFKYANGRVSIEQTAIAKVVQGTELKVDIGASETIIRAVSAADVPRVQTVSRLVGIQ